MSKRLSPELVRSPYAEDERHLINGKLVDVTYHLPDWWKCFHPTISERILTKAVLGYIWGKRDERCTTPKAIVAVCRMPEEDIYEYAEYYDDEMAYQRSLWAVGVTV